MHSFKTVMQALTVLSLEENEKIREKCFEILALALNHDVSEACLGGDIIKPIKDDPRLAGVVDEIEAEEFDKRFDELPPIAAKFLKDVNHIQGNESLVEGRFFQGIEYLGYTMFSLAEIAGKGAKEAESFNRVLRRHHGDLMKRCEEFNSLGHLYQPFVEPSYLKEDKNWNIEETLRFIIGSFDKTKSWPSFPSDETVLERTMKTAMLASILIPIELEKRKRRKKEDQLDGFIVLAAALVHNLAKATTGVLPHRLKTHPKFNRQAAREIEREKFLEVIADFPEETRILMTRAFDLEHDEESIEGGFFGAIKVLSYVFFALYEYERGGYHFEEILRICLPELEKYSGEFKSFDMFFLLIKHRIETIVEGKSRIWVEVK